VGTEVIERTVDNKARLQKLREFKYVLKKLSRPHKWNIRLFADGPVVAGIEYIPKKRCSQVIATLRQKPASWGIMGIWEAAILDYDGICGVMCIRACKEIAKQVGLYSKVWHLELEMNIIHYKWTMRLRK